MRGESVIAPFERPMLALDRWIEAALPADLNPFARAGAIANTMFAVAIVSGVLLLFWYVPSVTQAYASLEAARDPWWGGELVRSLHRYSSDACMLFVLLHAYRLGTARKFGGPRWLAWVTGIVALIVLWLVGWLGYWLVWDEGAREVALGTARILDVLPIFADPLARSFLTDATLNSLLFFVVFFFHMAIPLGAVIALWLHITRLSRPDYLARGRLAIWLLVSLVVLCIVFPARSAAPAHMLVTPTRHAIDAWYMLPIALTDRLGGGLLWLVTFTTFVVVGSVPWLLPRGRVAAAAVDVSKCNACNHCADDCPYGAIRMVPRTDGRKHPTQAQVDPKKCVGCGICAGSCDSSGIALPWLTAEDVRHNMDAFVARELERGERALVAFVCASAVARLQVDPDTGHSASLPGYLVWPVPCAGWVHALSVERALRHGASGVLIVACRGSSCDFREGAAFTEARLEGAREPALRRERVDLSRVRIVHVDRFDEAGLRAAAEAFRSSVFGSAAPASPVVTRPRRARVAVVVSGALLTGVLGLATAVGSALPYTPPREPKPLLVVSFKHPGKAGTLCRTLSAAELERLPVHMRKPVQCERGRASVQLVVRVDGKVVHDGAHVPRGIFHDGASNAILTFAFDPGPHHVDVALADEPGRVAYHDARTLAFTAGRRHVVLFDRTAGFTWE